MRSTISESKVTELETQIIRKKIIYGENIRNEWQTHV